jgi:hypothetical protein
VSSWSPRTRKDHQRFCGIEGWAPVRDARGRAGTHYVTHELALPDGRVLRTRISHPVDRTDYGPSLWAHVLRDQLDVSPAEFWACLRDDEPPTRSRPVVPPATLPADLVHLLMSKVGLSDAEVAVMSKEEAVARIQRYWTEGE